MLVWHIIQTQIRCSNSGYDLIDINPRHWHLWIATIQPPSPSNLAGASTGTSSPRSPYYAFLLYSGSAICFGYALSIIQVARRLPSTVVLQHEFAQGCWCHQQRHSTVLRKLTIPLVLLSDRLHRGQRCYLAPGVLNV